MEEDPKKKNQVWLTSMDDEIKAKEVQRVLKAHDIESEIRYRGLANNLQVYLGATDLGTDIFVLDKDYDLALQIIQEECGIVISYDEADYAEKEVEVESDENGKKPLIDRRVIAWILLLLLLAFAMPPAAVIAVIVCLILFGLVFRRR